jgi:hypothetical protein
LLFIPKSSTYSKKAKLFIPKNGISSFPKKEIFFGKEEKVPLFGTERKKKLVKKLNLVLKK